ncbi:phosphatidylcholine/phosphatidylserine synthase [Neisseriaceae bacterium PsAf]|nr:phosphatidylcholine/phosphatidylserine synthase [Neisseriaceae bacterium PsAf]MCV2503488.1 CDP-alcohol phosphatidyltransferase family protein [Neisseriaceae bacterium]
MSNRTYTNTQYAWAWTAHLFTSLGIVACALAMLALFQNEPSLCFFWLIVAYIIDGLDGSLARAVHVERLTNYDGFIMDSIIDYTSYVFVPVFIIYFYVDYPPYLKLFSISLILISSMYFFFKNNMKTHDFYFNGIPTMWQMIAIYMYVLSPEMPWINFFVTILFCILQDVDFNFVHPFRVKRLRYLTIFVTFLWTLTTLIIVFSEPAHANKIFPYMNVNIGHIIINDYSWGRAMYDFFQPWYNIIFFIWCICPIYIMGISTYRTYEKIVGKVAP